MADWTEVPFIGEYIKLVVVIIPVGLGTLVLGLDSYVFLKASIVGVIWLLVLQKWLHVRIVVPLIKLPWLWLCYAGIAIGLVIP